MAIKISEYKEVDTVLTSEPRSERETAISEVKIPGNIPSSMLNEERLGKLIKYLEDEITTAARERAPFIKKLARWKLAYRAPMPTKPKHFPIFNSSNITVPVIKEAVNTIAAQIVQGTLTARPRWVFKELAPEWETFIDDIEVFIDIASDRDLKLPQHTIPWIIGTVKYGTGMIEVGQEYDVRKYYRYSADGKSVYPKKKVIKDGPGLNHIPLNKWWIRMGETDIQSAPWCGKELHYTDHELELKKEQRKFEYVDDLIKSGGTTTRDISEAVDEEIEDTKPIFRTTHQVFEIWLSFDVDGDGFKEEIRVFYSHDARKILRAQFHPFDHGLRPFVKLGFFPMEDRFYDEGLCEMLEQLQASISQTTNRRADNAGLANLKMFIKKKIVKGLQPGDPLYSGKVIEAPDPFRDVREFAMSEIYPSTIQEESIAQGRADRLAGTNEGIAGAAMPVSRTTASAQLALLQEQAKRIDLAIRSMRDGLNEIGFLSLSHYFQFGTGGKAQAWLGVKRGAMVDAIFRLPRGLMELGYAMKAQTPTSLQNRQVQKENKIALFNLLMQLHEKILPIAQAFSPNELPIIAQGMVASANKYMVDVLETFEETDPESVLAGLTVLERLLPRPEDLGGLESITGGIAQAETLDAIGRLESSLRQAEASRDGGTGVRPVSGGAEGILSEERLPSGSLPGFGLSEES